MNGAVTPGLAPGELTLYSFILDINVHQMNHFPSQTKSLVLLTHFMYLFRPNIGVTLGRDGSDVSLPIFQPPKYFLSNEMKRNCALPPVPFFY